MTVRRAWRDPAVSLPCLVLLLVALACLLAPVYATRVSRSDPFRSTVDARIQRDGRSVPVLAENATGLGLGVTPVGPGWSRAYPLGADGQGRDVAARMLFAGRNSLLIAAGATAICLLLSGLVGTVSGFFGGWADAAISRGLDVLWALPVMLLAICLSLVLVSQDLRLGPVTVSSGSLVLPMAILGVVYVPYVARPVRTQVRGLRRAEFMRAAVALGVPNRGQLWRHVRPFVGTTLAGFAPLVMALSLLTESALSFLAIGVQPPEASWGTMIGDGTNLIYTRPIVAVAPGLAIVATVLALNVLSDALRDLGRDLGRDQGRER